MEKIKVPSLALYDNPDAGLNGHKAIFLIERRKFRRGKQDKERSWYYSGTLYQIEPTDNVGFPFTLRYSTTAINVSEKYIKPIKPGF